MTHARLDIGHHSPPAWKDPVEARLQREREAHALSRLALERELARGRRLEGKVLAI